jgi:dihydroceramide fatty acyl 2-hydroxylase
MTAMGLMSYTDELQDAAKHWSGACGPPNRWSRQHPQGITMYRSALIERVFAKAHPLTPGVWFGPLIAYGLVRSFGNVSSWAIGLLFLAGVLLWTLFEYVVHRFPMHRVLGPSRKRLPHFLLHGYHHEFPNDPMRLVAPLPASWGGALLVWIVYYFAVGPRLAWPLFCGTCAGYVAYDWIHYYTHHFRPKTRIGRFLRRYHMEHHYRDSTSHFGISSPLWDFVFGTAKTRSQDLEDKPRPAHDSA